ncbi:unnamed protein product [Schistosoma curassoni]|uniref:Transposase n=1 Tax=Schistosoma curassoni TaxID=6186 RepID=A0A183JRQ2_9TREM|nr:unnamed protein product [Schistosoma curassoni]
MTHFVNLENDFQETRKKPVGKQSCSKAVNFHLGA